MTKLTEPDLTRAALRGLALEDDERYGLLDRMHDSELRSQLEEAMNHIQEIVVAFAVWREQGVAVEVLQYLDGKRVS